MKGSDIIKLVISIGAPLALGSIAGIFTTKEIPEWYAALNKPTFSPPTTIFAPVWTTLYILMGISLFLVWRLPKSEDRNMAIGIFWVQMALNFAWSFIFFYFKELGLALIEIVLLLSCIVFMIRMFYNLKPIAAYLNIPYVAWVTFATILNASFYFLN